MHNLYIQFDKDNKFAGFNIQMLRQEPRLIDEEYTESVPTEVEKTIINEDGTPETIIVIEEVETIKTRQVHAIDDEGNLLYDYIEQTPLPENAFIITEQEHEDYFKALNSQVKDVVLIDGKIEIVDKFTEEELAEQDAKIEQQTLIAQAQQLLSNNDYRQTKALLGLYDEEKKEAVLSYMEALREVIRQAKQGNLTNLPIATF